MTFKRAEGPGPGNEELYGALALLATIVFTLIVLNLW